ncbi:MAG: chorismate synthase [Ignavibacteriaceae bacterium]|jgi:chorismate synthase|nr:chorismate synthase [Ignavibacteriaceae bacterium]
MIRFLTAGESHGKTLNAIVDGFPSNLYISEKYITQQLKRRQFGYGRGLRMKIESDKVEILSGVRFGKTLGSPVSILIKNNDWENWQKIMSVDPVNDKIQKISIPRPGHADLTGILKYNFDDVRNSIERSSARETAARVAAGSIARRLLEEFGIAIGSYVESIGDIYPEKPFTKKIFQNSLQKNFSAKTISDKADKSLVRVLEQTQEAKIINRIKAAKKKGDTLGGTFITVATGVTAGLGSFISYDTKLDAEIAHSIMSINAVKAVEIGEGFLLAEKSGSKSHDEIILNKNLFSRKTNHAGGIEGGISTGLPIIVRAAMKPIATLMSPIESVDLSNMKKVDARRERSDFVAVPACAVIAESMLAWSLAKYFIQKFGGDSLEEMRDNYNSYNKKLFSRIKNNFKK